MLSYNFEISFKNLLLFYNIDNYKKKRVKYENFEYYLSILDFYLLTNRV